MNLDKILYNQDFYKNDVHFINLKIIYLNKRNEIEKINVEPFFMSTPNLISKKEIIQILFKSTTNNNTKYSLFSILKYNINLNADEIHNFLQSEEINFQTTVSNIDTVLFEKTICLFQDLNDLILIFIENNQDK
jgi:hypothetical protein